MLSWRDFQGVNAGYALALYERFRQDPKSVDSDTRAFFERTSPDDLQPLIGVATQSGLPAEAALGEIVKSGLDPIPTN